MIDAKRAGAGDADPLHNFRSDRCDSTPQIAKQALIAAPDEHDSFYVATLQRRELIEAWRTVANAKLVEYRKQAWRLALLVRQGIVDKIAAVDRLNEIAIAHALVRALGEDRIEAIIAEAFADSDFHPMRAEVA